MNDASSDESTFVSIDVHSDKPSRIDAICMNCNKRLKSMCAISMHLKITATRHVVNIVDYGYYDKKTGLTSKFQTLHGSSTGCMYG